MTDLPTAEDLRNAADCITGSSSRWDATRDRLNALANALDAGTVRLVRADDEPPEGWEPSSLWWEGMTLPGWLMEVVHGVVRVTPTSDSDFLWSLPHGYPDNAVHRAPSLRVAQYRTEAALRAAGEQVPR